MLSYKSTQTLHKNQTKHYGLSTEMATLSTSMTKIF